MKSTVFDDWMLKNLSGRSDCSSHVLPHAALASTCGTWRQCGGAVSCESFVKLSMLGAQTLLQLMAHGSWLKPCTGCEFSAARWLALCHWVQTFTPTSSDHICEPNAEILAAAPQLSFDMFLFGGWWKLAELFGRHVQYIFKFQDVSSRFGLIKAPGRCRSGACEDCEDCERLVSQTLESDMVNYFKRRCGDACSSRLPL